MDKNNVFDRELFTAIQHQIECIVRSVEQRPGPVIAPLFELEKMVDEVIDGDKDTGLPREALRKIFTEIISCALAKIRPLRVGFLGPQGTFSNEALVDFFGSSVEGVSQGTIFDVFHDVETGKTDYGIVPIENSTEGAVTYTLDELIETNIQIVAEKYLRISVSFLSGEKSRAGIMKLYTHPQPLGQCKNWLRNNMPHIEICLVDSTTKAADLASREAGAAALASGFAASLYGLHVIEEHVEDSRINYTRFFIIGRDESIVTGHDKTSIVFSIKDRPGALFRVLSYFKDTGINMTKIESRPDKKKMWEYNFFIDFQGHRNDREVKKVLSSIKKESIFLKVLGSYPVGK